MNNDLQVGFVFFYQQVDAFSSIGASIVTLISGLTGGLDAGALAASNRILGPLFFIAFNVRSLLVCVACRK